LWIGNYLQVCELLDELSELLFWERVKTKEKLPFSDVFSSMLTGAAGYAVLLRLSGMVAKGRGLQ